MIVSAENSSGRVYNNLFCFSYQYWSGSLKSFYKKDISVMFQLFFFLISRRALFILIFFIYLSEAFENGTSPL